MTNTREEYATDRWRKIGVPGLLLFVMGVGAFLRFFSLDHGLPDSPAVDAFKFAGEAARMAAGHTMRPQRFQYPGLYTHILAAIYWLFHVESSYWLHWIGRVVAGLFGLGLVGLTYVAARRICSPGYAIFAAALIAISPLAVTYSRITATDTIVSFWMLAALIVLAHEPSRLLAYAVAGLLGGLAVGTKYTGGYLLILLCLTSLYVGYQTQQRRTAFGGAAVGLLVALLVFLCTTPWFLPLFLSYSKRFLLELEIQKFGASGGIQYGYFDYLISSTVQSTEPWLSSSMLWNVGPILLLVGGTACLCGLSFRFGFSVFLYSLYIVLYLFLISGPGRLKAYRFLLPILPVFFVLTAWGVERVFLRWRCSRFVEGMVITVLLAYPFSRTLLYIARTRTPTTNQIAYAWAKQHIPPDAKVFLSPLYTTNLRQLSFKTYVIPYVGIRQYRLPPHVGMSPERDLFFHPAMIDAFVKNKISYVVLNSYFHGLFAPSPDNRRWFPQAIRAHDAFLQALKRRGKHILTIQGYKHGRLGPDISVYRL